MTETENPPTGATGRGADLNHTSGSRCDCIEAFAWRWLCQSEHVLDLIREWSEWDRRRVLSETSRELSAAGRWSGGTSYAELERRRRLTSVVPCGRCGRQVELVHPLPERRWRQLPDLTWVRCPDHAEAAA